MTSRDSQPINTNTLELNLDRKPRVKEPSTLKSEKNEQTSSSSNFLWTTDKFIPNLHQFNSKKSGIQLEIKCFWNILDYFQLFVSEKLIEFIVEKTNIYWGKKKNKENINGTDINEFYCFIAITLLMSHNKRVSIAEHWSKHKLLRSYIFGDVISRDRYLLLVQMLHFSDDQVTSSDTLHKIRKIIDELRGAFSKFFYPYDYICIDESLHLYKNKQFIPSKGNKFGVESFFLWDCKTNYIQDFIVYTGTDTNILPDNKDYGESRSIVMSLLKPYLGKGHSLYVGNTYTSPTLFVVLHKNKTNACGIVNKCRKGMPNIDEKLQEGEASFRTTANMLAVKWQDNKEVYLLSTIHRKEFVNLKKSFNTKLPVHKPSCVYEYNKFMGTIDKADMVISSINCTRNTTKWYIKYFFHMIDMCLWNSYCLYKLKTGKKISISTFQLKLIDQILRRYLRVGDSQSIRPGINHLARLNERHFPSIYRKKGTRRCVVCSKNHKRRESRYQCEECHVGLCVYPCFKIYHTELNY